MRILSKVFLAALVTAPAVAQEAAAPSGALPAPAVAQVPQSPPVFDSVREALSQKVIDEMNAEIGLRSQLIETQRKNKELQAENDKLKEAAEAKPEKP